MSAVGRDGRLKCLVHFELTAVELLLEGASSQDPITHGILQENPKSI